MDAYCYEVFSYLAKWFFFWFDFGYFVLIFIPNYFCIFGCELRIEDQIILYIILASDPQYGKQQSIYIRSINWYINYGIIICNISYNKYNYSIKLLNDLIISIIMKIIKIMRLLR